jgi:hypothetical protein
MRKIIPTISLIAALSGLSGTANAQLVVWGDNFNSATNPYGGVAWNFSGAGVGNPQVIITNDLPAVPSTQNLAFTFDCSSGATLNFGWETSFLPATNNTDAALANYTLEFDMAVQGVNFSGGVGGLGGYIAPTFALFGPGSGLYFGQGLMTNPPLSIFPAAGTGYQHVSMPLNNFIAAHAALLNPTNSPLAFSIGFYIAGYTYTGIEEIDIANLQLTLNTNPPPPPQPTMTVLAARPGLRIFAQDSTFTYNQEGFGTVDTGQSWIYNYIDPVSYSVTFKDFDTVDNYSFYAQFAPGAGSGDPYGVYNAANSLTWRITRVASGFTTGISWKVGRPANGETNIALALITTSTNGRGTWTLTFTNNPDDLSSGGKVTAPDGTSGSFTLAPEVAAQFQNPCPILFGTAPNNTAGFGQYIDISSISITNVPGVNEYDDFTKDAVLNTALWNPAFSYNAGSVIQVSTNTSYWVNWTVPDVGYGLATKASLDTGTNGWFSPSYYGSGVGITNTTPTKMGYLLKWTLIPSACLPTVDGTTNGAVSPTAFFRLSNPAPSQ